MINLAPLFGLSDAKDAERRLFRVFPRSGAERWMIEATQRRPWHLKTWPRASFRARVIYRGAWTLGGLGLQLPHRLENFAVAPQAPYAQLHAEFDRLGIFLGTPGPNRKIVVYAASPERSVFVKIPLGPESAALVSREAEVLETLARDPDLARLVPAATCIAGHLAVENVETNGVTHAVLSIAELARIHNLLERRSATTRSLGLLRLDWPEGIKGAHSTHDSATIAAIEKARIGANRLLDGLPQDLDVPCYMAHGDFTQWNVLRAADGTARIIDWELFGLKPRWFDVVHYVVSHHLLVARTSAVDLMQTLRSIACEVGANLQDEVWWRQVGLYFAYQSLYYSDLYERQASLHPQALWQLHTWADILELMRNNVSPR